MSALDELDAFLQMSPSCIEPWEVRMYLDAIRDENAKLRELVRDAIYARDDADWASIVSTAIALGVEVGE